MKNTAVTSQRIIAMGWSHLSITGTLERDMYRRKYVMTYFEVVAIKTIQMENKHMKVCFYFIFDIFSDVLVIQKHVV